LWGRGFSRHRQQRLAVELVGQVVFVDRTDDLALVVCVVAFIAFQQPQHVQRFEFAPDGVSRPADATVDVVWLRVRVGGDVEQDFTAQRGDAVASAADGELHGALYGRADGHCPAHQLPELLGEASGHFQRMGIDDLAAIVALDAGAGGGDDVGGFDQLVDLIVCQRVFLLVDVADERAGDLRQFAAHLGFPAGVADGFGCGQGAAAAGIGADGDEAVPHGSDHGVRSIPRSGDGTGDDEPAGPGQRQPAVAADIALPPAVVDFAQGGEHGAARMSISAEDRGHILDDENAVVAELAEEAAGCPFAFLFARGGR